MAKDVRLYALSTCIHCKNTKQYLDENNVAYDCVYVDTLTGQNRTDTLEELKKINPSLSFPTMLIDRNTVVVGFRKDDIAEALGL